MHPERHFRADPADLIARATAIGFAHIFAATPDGPMVAHAPITLAGDDLVQFHLARANRLTRHVAGARLLLSIAGPHGYVSPNWYERPGNQVPTWNYVTIELEGVARSIDETALVAQLDALATRFESGERPWRRDKMDQAVFARMLRAIEGFEVTIDAARGTTKLSQNKSAVDRACVIAGLRVEGNEALAAAMAATG